ncbi:carbohydrate ABC transporter permease [Paenibacillus sp. NPDC058174]|uniref:carbohydrate ABC transporter permease n=1 Tax=Paenibacillus sp. NPDC058174 TaxID=3346366 RepID=UPI0036DF720E
MQRTIRQLLWHAAGFGFAALWIIPFVWVIRMAFLPKQSAIGSGWSWSFTLDNLIHVWHAAPFVTFFLNTLLVCGGVLAIQLVTLTMAAYAFARVRFAGRELLFMLFLVQIMVPPDVLIFSNYQVLNELGLLDTKVGIMLPYFASSFGVFLLRQSFKQLPNELEEAARVEGASRWRTLWQIFVPLSRPIYVSFAIVSVSFHWNDFLWPLIVTNSVDNRLLTVGLAMFAKSTESGAQWSDVSAATLIVAAPLMIAFLAFQKQVIGSFMSSGIKG